MPAQFTLPPDTRVVFGGNPPADINALTDAVTAMGAALNPLSAAFAGGADPTGAADSTAALNAWLAALGGGAGRGSWPAGTYKTTAPLAVPPGASWQGDGGWDPKLWGRIGTVIYPDSSFTGASVISVSDGGVNGVAGPRMRHFSVDGSRLPASVAGITVTGAVNEGLIEDVAIASVTGAGFVVASSANGFPHSWHGQRVKVNAAGGNCFTISNLADSTLIDFFALGSTGGHGVSVSGACPNTRLIGWRSEWNAGGAGKYGYFLGGAWGTGTGSGGLKMTGCTSDRNDLDGWHIVATGTVPLNLAGCGARRDGRNGGSGGGGLAGLSIQAATIPVLISGFDVFPGVDDNGTGTNSPQIGGQVTGTNSMVIINGAHFHGQVTGWATPGTGVHTRGMSQSTGSTSAPTGPSQVTDIA